MSSVALLPFRGGFGIGQILTNLPMADLTVDQVIGAGMRTRQKANIRIDKVFCLACQRFLLLFFPLFALQKLL